MPDSPNPSPTQEIARFDPQIAGATEEGFLPMDQMVDGAYVKYEDHQRLLQAEVERREAAEKAGTEVLNTAEGMLHYKDEAEVSNQRRIERDDLAAKLSSVVEDLERRADESEAFCSYMRKGEAFGYKQAIALLRDKGTEQGETDLESRDDGSSDDSAERDGGAGQSLDHGGRPRAVDRNRRDVPKPVDAGGKTHRQGARPDSGDRQQQVASGVAIEGDPGLAERLLSDEAKAAAASRWDDAHAQKMARFMQSVRPGEVAQPIDNSDIAGEALEAALAAAAPTQQKRGEGE